MATYKELLAQQKELEAKLKAAHAEESDGAIEQARRIVAEFGLTEADIFSRNAGAGVKKKEKEKGSVAAKYQDPESGKTWTGRGKAPLWIAGKDRDNYLIK